MASRALSKEALSDGVVNIIASEMARGVERAVECWMSQIEHAVSDVHLTSLGRLNAVCEIVQAYKSMTGKMQLSGRKESA